ncbi:flagellar biosynthesis protein FlhA [Spirochaeta isovalerica]|uniref:Flagellar biosynthesis protein FlhA n=1 Tax=Spirochaeta isovalerica TaxID=150 RepID=A0A841REY3_9SPIO|nr:flagellar biosynthesis protein FlhA [Spirochaeta isovalerica]MBB6481941.1 flagellar biosynthesis protein FlhA [Spirochaeta isovalerica]
MADIQKTLRSAFGREKTDLLITVGVLMIVMMLIVPLPTWILDTMMSVNLMLAIMIILIVLFTNDPLEFSLFPTILLVSTVFGLALNVSSTRLILAKGEEFDGRIVRAFATFVVGAEGTQGIVIGAIIFIIIIAVQFLVITKGATRVAEVAARFTLDALPGKQMAIDAEYNSGLITDDQARKKKSDLQKSVDFYGAMDGATKFVSGTVQVGIVITLINVIGGIIVGVTIHGEPVTNALNTYTSLTIGDGLVSQLPTLIISVSTGLIVTRSVSDGSFGTDVKKQFSAQSRIYWITAVFLFFLGVLPGFPWYLLFPLSAMTGFMAYRLTKRKMIEEELAKTAGEQEKAEKDTPAEMSPVVPLDPLSLELGYGLIPLVDQDNGAELLDRLTRIRREAALDLGLVVPRIRIIDNMRLEPSEYCLKIKGVEMGRGAIRMGHFLAINPGGERETLEGEKTTDPAFGLPAIWITEANREKAERNGYTVVDPPSIVATHLTEIIKKHSSEIIGRQEVRSMLDTLKENYPAVVEEVSKVFSTGEIQKVFQGLLKEQVSIRNLVVILETLGDYGSVTKDTGFLIEKVRQALGRQICLQYAEEDNMLRVLTVNPEIEQRIVDSRMESATGVVAALDPRFQRQWINAVLNSVQEVQNLGYYPLILCSEAARALVRSSTERDIPDLVVLSVPEIAQNISIESLGEISFEWKES